MLKLMNIFNKKKRRMFMGPIGVKSLAEVGRRLRYLEKDLIKHGMGISANTAVDIEPDGNRYTHITLDVVIFEHPVKDIIPKE